MVLKISSKFELRRFCRTAGAVAHVSVINWLSEWVSKGGFILAFNPLIIKQLKLSRPSPEDLGYVDSISVEEIGGVTVSTPKSIPIFLVNYFCLSLIIDNSRSSFRSRLQETRKVVTPSPLWSCVEAQIAFWTTLRELLMMELTHTR